MGIKTDSFDDLVAPVIQSSSISQDEFHECPDCEAPLMGEDLSKWQTEGICEYCGAENIETGESNSQTGSSSTTSKTTESSLEVIINTYPLQGREMTLPLGEIGRELFSNFFSGASHIRGISELSRDHIEIIKLEGEFFIRDLGSSNGTLLNGKQIFGIKPKQIRCGDIITLGSLNISPKIGATSILTHENSGVVIPIPDGTFHLGRITEDESREPWFRATSEVMQDNPDLDHNDLEYISRRHLFLQIKSGNLVDHTLEKGKQEWEIVTEDMSSKLSFNGQSFNINALQANS